MTESQFSKQLHNTKKTRQAEGSKKGYIPAGSEREPESMEAVALRQLKETREQKGISTQETKHVPPFIEVDDSPQQEHTPPFETPPFIDVEDDGTGPNAPAS